MSVSVGFAAHIVDLLDWLGIHLDPKWLSPAYLRSACRTSPATTSSTRLARRLRHPRLPRRLLLTVVLVLGIRESARTNNIMVLIKIAPSSAFVFFGISFIHPGNYHPFSPNGFSESSPAAPSSSSPTSASTPSPPPAKSAATRSATSPSASSPRWSSAPSSTSASRLVLTGIVPWQSVAGDGAPVVNALKRSRSHPAATACITSGSSSSSAPSPA
jgi:APA family basic amino acid/polyamine antiporter